MRPETTCDLRAVDVTKHYPDFSLEGASLEVPRDSVVGLVGQNGAGKSTLMRALLGTVRIDGGRVELFGQDLATQSDAAFRALRARVGYVDAVCSYPLAMSVAQVARMTELAFPRFDRATFEGLCQRLGLVERGAKPRSVKELSRGMGMKLQLCCALASGIDLLVLDEPTSGLDPIVREEVLDVIRTWMETEGRSVLISSHITSDLEKIADYVVMLDAGRITLSCARDIIDDGMGIARLRMVELERVLSEGRAVTAGRTRVLKRDLSFDVLVDDRTAFIRAYPDYVCDRATIDDVMALMIKGELR